MNRGRQLGGFFGRADTLRALDDILVRSIRGSLAIAVVEGEAGIGKTRLIAEAMAARGGFQTFSAHAEELERTRPFGVVADALGCHKSSADPRRAALARLITAGDPEGESVTVTSDPGLRFRAVEDLVVLVEEETLREGPVALVLEDLQWADPSSLLTIRALSRQVADLPIALLATMRPVPRTVELTALLDVLPEDSTTRLVLGALDEEAVTDLVTYSLAAEPGAALLDKVAGAAGNPLFITELVSAFDDEGSITIVDGKADLTEGDFPPTLPLTILSRVGFLEPATLDALTAASILGSRFTLSDLAVTTGRAASDLSTILRDAKRAGVLHENDSRLCFRHDLIREAIYNDISPAVRGPLHRDAAGRLADAGAPSLQVAEHLLRGAIPGDAEAVAWLTRAAREASPASPVVAAELFAKALDLAGPSWPDRHGLLAERAASLLWSGRTQEAEALCLEVLGDSPPPTVEAALLSSLIQIGLGQGRPSTTLANVDRALESPALSEAERARILAWGAHSRMLLGDAERASSMARSAWSTARKLDDHLTIVIAMCCASMVEQLRGRFDESVRIAGAAVKTGDASAGHHAYRFQIGVFHGLFLMDLDRIDEGIASLLRGSRISETIGARWNLPLYEIGLIVGYFLTGSWDDAVAEFDTGRDLAGESGTRHGMVCNNAVRGMIALHRDERPSAEEFIGAAEQELAETGPQYRADWASWARALLLEAAGRVHEAAAMLWAAWDACARMGIIAEYPILAPDLLRLSIAAGDRSRVEEAVLAVEELASAEQAPWLIGVAHRCRGLMEDDPNKLLAALDAYRSSPRLLDRAATAVDAGDALARAGDTEPARAAYEEALEMFSSLNASRDVARVEAALRAIGAPRGRRGSRNRPRSGWDSLTETERRVVDLVAEGLSNPGVADRLFVSARTVQTHLSHVFGKLGISSRTELVAKATQRR